MNSTHSLVLPSPHERPEGEKLERLRRIDELKQKIRSGTYLINKYEIIDGLINELASAAVHPIGGE
jgi:anti-sigma28 factor (negative regulator of flagellin synthesis)